MKNIYLESILACAAATVMVSRALAGDMYALGSVGSTMAASNIKSDADMAFKQAGLTQFQSSLSNGNGFKVGLGYWVSSAFAVEATYLSMGTITYSVTANGQSASMDLKPTGLNLSFIGKHAINDTLSIMGKMGYTSATLKSSVSAGAQNISLKDSEKSSGGYGFGAIFDILTGLKAR